jgi:glutamate carboxypeptidase
MRPLLDFCASNEGSLRSTIETLVRLESPSTDKAAVDRCGEALSAILASAGARVTKLPQRERGDHVRAEFAGGPRQVLILGHFDTVWDVGQIERMPFREEAGRLHGPGIFDMKSSIAVALLAVRALLQLAMSAPRVVMLWTTDEEIGSATSRGIIEAEARASDAVLVVEPSLPGGAAKTHRKGCGEFTLTIRGVAAHAGIDPRKGASAIHELARQIVALEALADLDRGISVNVGVVSGGTRGNVTAEEARAVIDVRVPAMADVGPARSGAPRVAASRSADHHRGCGRGGPPAAGAQRRRRASVRACEARCRVTRARALGGKYRRRLRREFHSGTRCSNIRWSRARRGWCACAARAHPAGGPAVASGISRGTH